MSYSILKIIVIATLSQALLILIALGSGRWLAECIFKNYRVNAFLRLGTAYYFGIALLITLLKMGIYITGNASLSAKLILATLCIFAFFGKSLLVMDISEIHAKIHFKKIISAALLFSIVVLAVWLPASSALNEDPFAFVGSLHSVRYAWVANFIEVNNILPIIPQNTGQSILAYASGSIAIPAPNLYLYLWLITTILFLSFFIFGLIYERYPDLKKCILGLAIFMMGNTALSVTHILIIDSGSPFAFNGYSDTLLGVFFILSLFLINSVMEKSLYKRLLLIATILISLNFSCAPQNIIFMPIFMTGLFIFEHVNNRLRLQKVKFWLLATMLATAISLPQGGMLTPKKLLTKIDYPGVMSLTSQEEFRLRPKFGVPFHFGWAGEWTYGLTKPHAELWETYQDKSSFIRQYFLWLAEQIIFTSLRILAIPIIGLSYWLYFRKREERRMSPFNISTDEIAIYGFIFLLSGFMMSFPLSINQYKWELSRFLIPGIAIGMLGFTLASLAALTSSFKYKKSILWFIGIFVLGGPVANIALLTTKNVVGISRDSERNPKEYLDALIRRGPAIIKQSP